MEEDRLQDLEKEKRVSSTPIRFRAVKNAIDKNDETIVTHKLEESPEVHFSPSEEQVRMSHKMEEILNSEQKGQMPFAPAAAE